MKRKKRFIFSYQVRNEYGHAIGPVKYFRAYTRKSYWDKLMALYTDAFINRYRVIEEG